MTRPRLRVVVQDAARSPETPSPALLRKWARAALGRDTRGELTIRIVDEAESAELNTRYRRKTGPTNVLAFPATLPGAAELPAGLDDGALGDLVVCAPVVQREAAEQRKAVQAHWAHIVVHGALHLAGYDHDTDAEASVMEDRERELLTGLGFDDPYT